MKNLGIEEALKRPTMNVEDAADILGVSRATAYTAAKNGDIEAVWVGRRLLVLTAPLKAKLGLQ